MNNPVAMFYNAAHKKKTTIKGISITLIQSIYATLLFAYYFKDSVMLLNFTRSIQIILE